MTRPVIVIGAGGHGRVVADALLAAGVPLLGFVDQNEAKWNQQVMGMPTFGGDLAIQAHDPAAVWLANGIGSTSVVRARRDVFVRFHDLGFQFVTVVHPRATVSPHATLGEGAQVMAGAVVQPGSTIGANSIVNTGAQVDHDCVIGAHCHLAPGCVLSGGVMVGSESHVGTGAVVIQSVRIGMRALVGAGSVVTTSVADDRTVIGVPARETIK